MATHETASLTRAARIAKLSGIYLIVNEGHSDPLVLAQAALSAGIRVVQYRAKTGIVPENLRRLRRMTREAAALLILNDDWQASLDYDCDGVHLGPDDRGWSELRSIRGAVGSRLIGVSCGTAAESKNAAGLGADYVGVGSVFATASKDDAGEPIGIAGLMRVAAATSLPVAAIGGIDAERLRDVRASGVAMAAVISAVSGAGDPFAAALRLVRGWDEGGRAAP